MFDILEKEVVNYLNYWTWKQWKGELPDSGQSVVNIFVSLYFDLHSL